MICVHKYNFIRTAFSFSRRTNPTSRVHQDRLHSCVIGSPTTGIKGPSKISSKMNCIPITSTARGMSLMKENKKKKTTLNVHLYYRRY